MPKALLIRNGKLRNFAYTFVTSFQGIKTLFCVLEDESLSAEDELFREEGQKTDKVRAAVDKPKPHNINFYIIKIRS